jgi:hypothetical protein
MLRKALHVLITTVLGRSRSMTVLALQRPGGTNYFCVLRCAPQHAVLTCALPLCCWAALLHFLLSCCHCRHVVLESVLDVRTLHMECRQGLTDSSICRPNTGESYFDMEARPLALPPRFLRIYHLLQPMQGKEPCKAPCV